jgi:small-conductance mechanosensitive channel
MLLGPSLLARVLELLRWQFGLTLLLVAAICGLVELWLRGRWTASRRALMNAQLLAMRSSLIVSSMLWGLTRALLHQHAPEWAVVAAGFPAIVAWLATTLQVARVFVFQWLFAHSEHEGVPLLLVDIFTIAASGVLFASLLHAVFLIEVTSLLATSAVVSVVLGLALQDTLGQLFAGISLQLDRPFRLGDWIEVRAGGERISGQVREVSWRATQLLAIGEELVTIPNKLVAQGLVLNFSGRERPFVRSHVFRVTLDADLALVKRLLLEAAAETPGVVAEPAPTPLLIETTESWITLKMINYVTDYAAQFTIGDEFQVRALALLARHGVKLAATRIALIGSDDATTSTAEPPSEPPRRG